ncbi:MAG: PhzF family phenazine biosynthesis isomerase, partial [Bacteroidales bacterium]|nr:PhzF family phenazine biosynthesis isomerase [Bacteroidales bacterium]
MKSSKHIYHVDAFTAEPFRGNPAAVCILTEEPGREWMQNVAMEMNLSETAFLFPEEDRLNIRFFTPATEIDLCGHATLSASHILYETGRYNPGDTITLYSKAGELRITTDRGWIKMNFPAYDFKPEPVPSGFRQIVGAQAAEYFSSAYGWKIALLDSESTVSRL